MQCLAARREYQNMQTLADVTRRLKARLAVIPAIVLNDQRVSPLKLRR